MKNLLIVLLLSVAAPTFAQNDEASTAFLNKFETFVVSIENNDSTVDWEKSNSKYKALREEYKESYKGKLSNSELTRYNKLKTRYIKQVSLKKVGKGIGKKASSITSSVKGAVEGVFH